MEAEGLKRRKLVDGGENRLLLERLHRNIAVDGGGDRGHRGLRRGRCGYRAGKGGGSRCLRLLARACTWDEEDRQKRHLAVMTACSIDMRRRALATLSVGTPCLCCGSEKSELVAEVHEKSVGGPCIDFPSTQHSWSDAASSSHQSQWRLSSRPYGNSAPVSDACAVMRPSMAHPGAFCLPLQLCAKSCRRPPLPLHHRPQPPRRQ